MSLVNSEILFTWQEQLMQSTHRLNFLKSVVMRRQLRYV